MSYHFTHLLLVSKKSLWSLILYNFFHDLIHVYSPGAGAYSPLGDKNFDVNRNFLSLWSSIASFKSHDNSFWKIYCFTFFPYESIREQIWPCRKIGQGQPTVIISTNLVVLLHPMLHTKFQGHQPFGSGEEDFLRFLAYMGMAAILVMWPGLFWTNFRSPVSKRLHMKFGFKWPSGFREDVWKCWEHYTHMDDRGLPIL